MGSLRRGTKKFVALAKEALLSDFGLSESDFEQGDRQRQSERDQQRKQKGRPFYGQ